MAMKPGFDVAEATTLLEIAQQTYGSAVTPGAPPVPKPPAAWVLDSTLTPSGTTLLDNCWQVWRNAGTGQAAIAIRGTVETAPSVLEDLFLPLLEARMSLSLAACGIPETLDLDFAQGEGNSAVVAGVHAGFALGLVLMLVTTDAPLAATLEILQLEGTDVFITGHSQGASVATLLTALVHHSSLYSKLSTKTYVFAPAKPGNDHLAYDYDQLVGVPGFGFSVVSTQDWVPQVPLTLQGFQAVNTPNPLCPFQPNQPCSPGASLLTTLPTVAAAGAASVAAPLTGALGAAWSRLVGRVRSSLPQATFALPASRLGSSSAAIVGQDCLESILDQLEGLLLPSLNFTAAGVLVPVFATPGTNPVLPSDGFWQHHLGNYLKYLTAQYGG